MGTKLVCLSEILPQLTWNLRRPWEFTIYPCGLACLCGLHVIALFAQMQCCKYSSKIFLTNFDLERSLNYSVGYNCESCSHKCKFQVYEKIYLYYTIYLFWWASLPQKSHVNTGWNELGKASLDRVPLLARLDTNTHLEAKSWISRDKPDWKGSAKTNIQTELPILVHRIQITKHI
jgi:hypothetical protein